MANIKKHYNFKIISLFISIVFCLNTSVYSLDIHAKSHLRPNLLSDSREGNQKIKDVMTELKPGIHDYRPGWTFEGWGIAKKAIKQRFKSTNERKETLLYIRSLARTLANNKIDTWPILNTINEVVEAAKNKYEFGLFINLAIKLVESKKNPVYILEYVVPKVAIAITSLKDNERTKKLKEVCNYIIPKFINVIPPEENQTVAYQEITVRDIKDAIEFREKYGDFKVTLIPGIYHTNRYGLQVVSKRPGFKVSPLIPLKIRIISGGQTGVDTWALETARSLNLETGGTAPSKYMTEEGPNPSLKGLGLVEDPSPDYPPRTEKNIINSDGTVIFGDTTSRGSKLAIRLCKKHGKERIENPTVQQLREFAMSLSREGKVTLNIAGNRKSINPDLEIEVVNIITGAFAKPITINPVAGQLPTSQAANTSLLRPRLIFDQDGIKASELYEIWQKKYTEQADVLLSIFGERALDGSWARQFIEKILDIAINISDGKLSKTRLLYLARIVKPDLWIYIFEFRPLEELSDDFLYKFIKNNTTWWDLPPEEERVDPADIPELTKVKTRQSTVSRDIILAPLKSLRPRQKPLKIPPHNSLPLKVYVEPDAYKEFSNILITTEDKNFIQKLEKIATKKDFIAGLKGGPQPVFYLRVAKVKGEDDIVRMLISEFQHVVRLRNNHPKELKSFMADVEKFAYWLLQNYPEELTQGLAYAGEPCERISFFTTAYETTLSRIPITTASRWYTYSPREAGFKLVTFEEMSLLLNRPLGKPVNFLWELPIKNPINNQLSVLGVAKTNL